MEPENKLNNSTPPSSAGSAGNEQILASISRGPNLTQKDDSNFKPPTAVAPPSIKQPGKSPAPNRWQSILSTVGLFVIAPIIALSIAAFGIQSYQVDGQSMETSLQDHDRLIVNKTPRTWARLTHHAYIPHRGDIIIFNQLGLDFSGSPGKQLIKRVIGLPGERVVVKDGHITISNKAQPAAFDPDKLGLYSIAAASTPGDVNVTLASNEVFVCGDNRLNSEDSRYFGPVKTDHIVGKLVLRILPLNKAQRF